jgi:P27 family predicted phage terminase small subunit
MGRRGPIPMSNALRMLKGNPGRRPLARREPAPPRGIPDAPDWLSAAARAEWDRITPPLAAMGVLTPLDRTGLAVYCVLCARVIACEADLQARGMLLQGLTQRGKARVHQVPNPNLSILHTTLGLLRVFLAEFGMSPASRSRIRVEPPAPVSELERFVRRHRGAARPPVRPEAPPA